MKLLKYVIPIHSYHKLLVTSPKVTELIDLIIATKIILGNIQTLRNALFGKISTPPPPL